MESDIRSFEAPSFDLPSDDGWGDLPPVEDPGPEPLPPRPPAPRAADPEPATGPWFALSMGVFVAWAVLTMVAMQLQRSAGEVGAWLVISGFIGLYWGFLVVGARWFGAWRHSPVAGTQRRTPGSLDGRVPRT